VADNPKPLADGLHALSQFFIAQGTLGATLTKVSELACEVSQADMAGITLLVEGKPRTGVFTDPEAQRSTAPNTTPARVPAWMRSATASPTGSTPPNSTSAGRPSPPQLSSMASTRPCHCRSSPATKPSARSTCTPATQAHSKASRVPVWPCSCPKRPS